VLTKYFFFFILSTIIYLAYQLLAQALDGQEVLQPVSNVTMKKNFAPLVGDFEDFIEDIKNGRPHYQNEIEFAQEVAKYDFYLMHEGKGHVFLLNPNKLERR
jgi:hypothetical protein